MVACGEEIIFRGTLFRFVDDRWGLWPALVVSALIFGFIHILNPGASLLSSIFIAIEAGLLIFLLLLRITTKGKNKCINSSGKEL